MRIFLVLILAFCLIPLTVAADLPDCYHDYDEIISLLFDYEQQYPDFAKVHLLGYSQQDHLPIYALQISADVEGDWERPALLFVGQVHAEEVLGVEITLSNIHEILSSHLQLPYVMWVNQLDTWWVPTLNPEGHQIVSSNQDLSFRKNKRDNNENGIFDFSVLIGQDVDGVDINRNFGFNWVHGDTLYQPPTEDYPEAYDYYRGPGPNSESEVQAIIRLAKEKKFTYSICWHSSRQGGVAEKVFYSFNWRGIRPSPDLAFAHSIAQGVAGEITKESGVGSYEFYPNSSRRGAFHDWMYQQFGTIQLLIEVGTRNLQPEEDIMLDTISRATNGVWWLLNRALMYSTAVPSSSMLTGHTVDAISKAPISAEIIVPQHHAAWFKPRLSFPDTGRFYKLLPMGNYTVQARKKGYWDIVLENVTVNNSSWTITSLELEPKAEATLYGEIRSGGTPIPARIIIHDTIPDTLFVDGEYIFHGYEGEYEIEIHSEGYYPYLGTITLEPGAQYCYYNLSPATMIFGEDWEDGTDAWITNSDWVLQNELSVSGNAITDSWGGSGNYAQNCDVWIQTANPIQIPEGDSALLYFDSHLYTEWDHDPVTVEVSADGEDFCELFQKSGCHDNWQKEYVSLQDCGGQSVYLRFRLRDASTTDDLTDPGWTIDNICLIAGSATHNENLIQPPHPVALYPNYPNPFNPQTTISYSIGCPQPVLLEIFNIKGQKVLSYNPGIQGAGKHQFIWQAKDDLGREVASGLYFYRLSTEGYSKSRKMVLLK